mmetsp:Transcript_39172/g.92815  ORF Transcript_39172/g.92815 Transcript_39172/m.92815 type:complete len:321 (-) Transcript_39172:1072-2034(-)
MSRDAILHRTSSRSSQNRPKTRACTVSVRDSKASASNSPGRIAAKVQTYSLDQSRPPMEPSLLRALSRAARMSWAPAATCPRMLLVPPSSAEKLCATAAELSARTSLTSHSESAESPQDRSSGSSVSGSASDSRACTSLANTHEGMAHSHSGPGPGQTFEGSVSLGRRRSSRSPMTASSHAGLADACGASGRDRANRAAPLSSCRTISAADRERPPRRRAMPSKRSRCSIMVLTTGHSGMPSLSASGSGSRHQASRSALRSSSATGMQSDALLPRAQRHRIWSITALSCCDGLQGSLSSWIKCLVMSTEKAHCPFSKNIL